MQKFVIKGGKPLRGTLRVSGAKNVALKALVAACLTEEEVIIDNVPLISDLFTMIEIIKELGGKVTLRDHTVHIQMASFAKHEITLDAAVEVRTSSLFIAPLLARVKQALMPNPGGCRIGARPIDRTIEGLKQMAATITYQSEDGYFHATTKGLVGTEYTFEKNTHTGTETMLLAASLAEGTTILHNAAEEPEVDELIGLLNHMGAHIKRTAARTIEIQGVKKLHGTRFRILPDRNEIVTFIVAAYVTKGDITICETKKEVVKEFLEALDTIGAAYEETKEGMRFYYTKPLLATDITTSIYPGFMTDWQAPWAVLMAVSQGTSSIHETVFENRFSYAKELRKMGVKIRAYNPEVKNPKQFYNFNMEDDKNGYVHAVKITGPSVLHNAVVTITDLRAGATLVLAALAAKGKSVVFGIEHADRGYERFEQRLESVGADIKRVIEE